MWIIQQVESMDSSSKICNSDMFDMTISFGMMALLEIIYVDFCLKGHLVSNYIEGPAPTIISCFSKDIWARSWFMMSMLVGQMTFFTCSRFFDGKAARQHHWSSNPQESSHDINLLYMNWTCWTCTLCHESRKWYAMYVWMYACMYVRMYTVQYTIIEAINTLNHTLPVTDFTPCHPDFTPGSESAAVQGLTLAPRNCVKTQVAWDVLFHSISQNTTCGIFSVLKMAVRYYEVPEVFSWVSWRSFIHTSFSLCCFCLHFMYIGIVPPLPCFDPTKVLTWLNRGESQAWRNSVTPLSKYIMFIQQLYTYVDCIWLKANAFRCFWWSCSNIFSRRDVLIKKLITRTNHQTIEHQPSLFVHLLLKETNGRLLEGHGVTSLSIFFLQVPWDVVLSQFAVNKVFSNPNLWVSGVPVQNPGGDQLGWWKYWSCRSDR